MWRWHQFGHHISRRIPHLSRIINQNGFALRSASLELRDAIIILSTAIENTGCSLQSASERLRDDLETVLKAVNHDGTH